MPQEQRRHPAPNVLRVIRSCTGAVWHCRSSRSSIRLEGLGATASRHGRRVRHKSREPKRSTSRHMASATCLRCWLPPPTADRRTIVSSRFAARGAPFVAKVRSHLSHRLRHAEARTKPAPRASPATGDVLSAPIARYSRHLVNGRCELRDKSHSTRWRALAQARATPPPLPPPPLTARAD